MTFTVSCIMSAYHDWAKAEVALYILRLEYKRLSWWYPFKKIRLLRRIAAAVDELAKRKSEYEQLWL